MSMYAVFTVKLSKEAGKMLQLESQTILVGVKQTTRSIADGHALKVYVARNAEQHVIRRVIELAAIHSVEIEYIDTMKELGYACNIDVGAATAVIIK